MAVNASCRRVATTGAPYILAVRDACPTAWLAGFNALLLAPLKLCSTNSTVCFAVWKMSSHSVLVAVTTEVSAFTGDFRTRRRAIRKVIEATRRWAARADPTNDQAWH